MIENNRWDDFTLITQGGISQAAIIYEMQVEKITRNMAIFMDIDQVGEILPVRSARSYFVSAALAYDAIYVHRGQSADGVDFSETFLVNYTDNDNIDLGNSNSYRMTEWPHVGEHGMGTSGELLLNSFEAFGTRTEHNTDSFDYGLHFTENAAPTDGEAAGSRSTTANRSRNPSRIASVDGNSRVGSACSRLRISASSLVNMSLVTTPTE